MVAHDFIVKNKKRVLNYRLIFGKNYFETITLPTPSLFDLSAGKYLVPPEAIHAHRNPTPATEPEPEPSILTGSLFFSGIQKRSPTSGTRGIFLSTTPTITLDIRQASRGHRPT